MADIGPHVSSSFQMLYDELCMMSVLTPQKLATSSKAERMKGIRMAYTPVRSPSSRKPQPLLEHYVIWAKNFLDKLESFWSRSIGWQERT